MSEGWSRKPRSSSKHQLRFDFTELELERLEKIMHCTFATSRAEVIRQALILYGTVLSKKLEGSRSVDINLDRVFPLVRKAPD